MDTGLETVSMRSSVHDGSPDPSGTIAIEKVAITLKPHFKSEQPPCSMKITVVRFKLATAPLEMSGSLAKRKSVREGGAGQL